jgi:hypothetical protein
MRMTANRKVLIGEEGCIDYINLKPVDRQR